MVKIRSGTCEERDLALVSTLAECKEAALKLGESKEVRGVLKSWPYCFSTSSDSTIHFDPTGIAHDRPARLTGSMNHYGLCKKGTVHTIATPVLKPP